MKKKLLPLSLVMLLLLSMAPPSSGNSNGIYNQGSGCGGGYCHGNNINAAVSMTGQPASYTPNQTYTLSISVTGGSSGSTNGGFSLDASKGTLSAGGMGIMAVKVNSAGTSATHTTNSYRSWSVDWIAPATGTGIVTFDLAGNAADGNNYNTNDNWDSTSYQVPEAGGTTTNSPPAASNLQLTPSNPVTTDTLSLTYTYQDSDGDVESGTEINWYKDGVLENSGATLNQLTVPPSLTSKGETWNATVIPSDGADPGASVTSGNLLIVNSAPVIQNAEVTPQSPVEEDNLTLSWDAQNITDADDLDQWNVSGIEWYVDGSKVSAFDNDVTIPSVAIRDGDVWYAKLRVNDGEIDSAWFTTQQVTIGSDNSAPTMTSVSLGVGDYTTVDELTASALGEDIDGDVLTYQWEWPGSLVTTSTLPSSETSKGESWTVRCRVTDGEIYSDWMESSVKIIQNTAPVLTGVTIDQESIFFESEATYTFEATDADEDTLFTNEVWSLDGEILTLTLTVNDDDLSYSSAMSDTVTIANTLPTATYLGSTTQDALSDIDPVIETDDANGETVTISWMWMRNGFTTDYNQSLIPTSSIGAGDVWTAFITPNDGIEDGALLIIEFTITNTAPTAVITAPASPIQGSSVTFSASDSIDNDGAIVNAIWSIDGSTVFTGITFTTLMKEEMEIQVKVIDDMGATDTVSDTYFGLEPPYATNTEATTDGNDIVLTWEGDAEEWAVVHNGEVIGTTTSTNYRHAPTMSGEHTYSVLPIVDGQQIQWDGETSSDNVELSSSSVPEAPGPSQTAGLIFSIILLLIGITGVAFSFIPRRD
jgi:hypothetical protein